LARAIYAASARGAFARDFALRDQMRKAAISTMSNIAEGFEPDGKQEFVQFLAIAKGSVGEIQSQLYVARDQGFVREAEFEPKSVVRLQG
jgi:four helix bundle protein